MIRRTEPTSPRGPGPQLVALLDAPVLVACLDAARAERAFGVWAGRDHDPTRPDRDTTGEDTTP